ncbi:hypothetical protein BCR39DRAFT_369047 [Naematelia encephala]|uniref:Ubiquitin-like protease family profile domain-containing protein n=1 Tax=Naematelia encephala TaxID=71784 RepID=A0A1Y2AK17_9TREE|nr:hypothetical protein BCR39DRAFT_369047 [Naematelia encephala]
MVHDTRWWLVSAAERQEVMTCMDSLESFQCRPARSLSDLRPVSNLSHDSFKRLDPGPSRWLNDECIDAYLSMMTQGISYECCLIQLIIQRGYEDVGMDRWQNKTVELFSRSVILLPINVDNAHWVAAAIYPQLKTVVYYDPLLVGVVKHPPSVIINVYDFLDAETSARGSGQLHLADWKTVVLAEAPHQVNGSDCGVYVLLGLVEMSRGFPWQGGADWKWGRPGDSSDLRLCIAHELLMGSLIAR